MACFMGHVRYMGYIVSQHGDSVLAIKSFVRGRRFLFSYTRYRFLNADKNFFWFGYLHAVFKC